MASPATRPRIILAYSGAPESTAAIGPLREQYEVVAATIDLGQGEALAAVRDRALANGAERAHVLDLREEFARAFVLPTLQAAAVDRDGFPLIAPLNRAAIARGLLEIASMERASFITYRRPSAGAGDCMATAVEHLSAAGNAPLTVRAFPAARRTRQAGTPRVHSSLWGRACEWRTSTEVPSTSAAPPYALTRPPSECTDQPAHLDIGFEGGVPTSINGVPMPLVELIAALAAIAGAHGVGRGRVRSAGRRRYRLAEAPAGVLLHRAHRELQRRLSPDLERFGLMVGREYASLAERGRWFSPARAALDAYVQHVGSRLTGVVSLTLLKGDFAVGRHVHEGRPAQEPARGGAAVYP